MYPNNLNGDVCTQVWTTGITFVSDNIFVSREYRTWIRASRYALWYRNWYPPYQGVYPFGYELTISASTHDVYREGIGKVSIVMLRDFNSIESTI